MILLLFEAVYLYVARYLHDAPAWFDITTMLCGLVLFGWADLIWSRTKDRIRNLEEELSDIRKKLNTEDKNDV